MEKAGATQDKLRCSESEIRTLKSLLTSKTAMVERRKRELAETQAQLLRLEEKDNHRSVLGRNATVLWCQLYIAHMCIHTV